jgi:hypothetical protein
MSIPFNAFAKIVLKILIFTLKTLVQSTCAGDAGRPHAVVELPAPNKQNLF